MLKHAQCELYDVLAQLKCNKIRQNMRSASCTMQLLTQRGIPGWVLAHCHTRRESVERPLDGGGISDNTN